MKKIIAIVVAGGESSRMGEKTPKVYMQLSGKHVLDISVEALKTHPQISGVIVVINEAHGQLFDECECSDSTAVIGGKSRSESVKNGLRAASEFEPDFVLIHDAARPFLSHEIIDNVLNGLENADGIIPAIAVTDTIKKVKDGAVIETVPREDLVAVQTPQGFDFEKLLAAHERFETSLVTDDAQLMEMAGYKVKTVNGTAKNFKITTKEDWEKAQWLVK